MWRPNLGCFATGNEVGSVAVIPKSKPGGGACFSARNSYARWLLDCGVVSGVGGNSKLNVFILLFSLKTVLGAILSDLVVWVTSMLAVFVIVDMRSEIASVGAADGDCPASTSDDRPFNSSGGAGSGGKVYVCEAKAEVVFKANAASILSSTR